jgi:acyl-CoA synthetase (AMP-forming)/AMP-acid ligase II
VATYNLADLFELVADAVPDRTAIVAGERRLSYAQLDERSSRLAHHLAGQGIGERDHVGLQMVNGTEYVEGMLAAFKLRAVPVNVNYRYVSDELRHLFDDADLKALIVNERFVDRVRAIKDGLPLLKHALVVETDYEHAIEVSSPARDFGARSSDDIYIAYTGGTTGLPKGVLWRHEDIFFAAMGGGDPFHSGAVVSRPDQLLDKIPDVGLTALAVPPFMHVSAHWLVFSVLFGGGTMVVVPGGRFEPGEIWQLVARERVQMLIIVGDAMGRPLADQLARGDYDTTSLLVIGSGGAVLSPVTKEQLSSLVPHAMVVDGFGASETGTLGSQATFTGSGPATGARFPMSEHTVVLDDDLRPVIPGSGVVGRLARRGHIPLGYYNDPEKTASTFVEVDGERYVVPGDFATVEADGTVVLLGRGSVSINTGGEKVYPEEVEAAVKGHPDVFDAVVVGVPDERWGERVVAVVQPRLGRTPALEDVQAFCRDRVAGYKVPRDLVVVDEVVRSPSGKTDYRWARETARRDDRSEERREGP